MLVDTHAHLTAKEFDGDRDQVIRRAIDSGVRYIVVPAIDLADSRKAVALADQYESVYACVGIHPHEAKNPTEESFQDIEELSAHPRVVAIGEIGLDYYYDFSPKDVQKRVFRAMLEIAGRRNLPVVIHTRDSLSDTIEVVESFTAFHSDWGKRQGAQPGPRGVFHCFSGDLEAAQRVISARFYVSFPGIITFKNASSVQEVAAQVPLDDLLVETDSPYMTPVPHRGKRNEPSNVRLIAERIAELQQLPADDVERITTYNSYDLFGIGDPEPLDAA